MNAGEVACRLDFHHEVYQIITRSFFSAAVWSVSPDLFCNNRARSFVENDNTYHCYFQGISVNIKYVLFP